MSLKPAFVGVAANLDDYQLGLDALSRSADSLEVETENSGWRSHTPLGHLFSRHLKDLRTRAQEQRAVLQALRNDITRLQDELARTAGAYHVKRCLICGDGGMEAFVDSRFVTTSCTVCHATLVIEFDPPDNPALHARIERID
jgi:hypothetical protein